MKKLNFFMIVIGCSLLSSCAGISPNGDEEAVLIEKPWIWGHGGINTDPVKSGNEWVALSTECVKFKIVPMTYTEKFDNLMTADNTPVDFSVYIKLQVQAGKTPILYKGFGDKWYENSLAPTIRTLVRDKNSSYHMFELTSKREIIASIEKDLQDKIAGYMATLKGSNGEVLPVTLLQVTVGAITPPKDVLDETSKTAAQNQSKLTQEARANSELARKQAEVNKAIADKAYMEEMHMSIDQYIRIRELEIRKEKVELVKDNRNATLIFNDGSNVSATVPAK